MPETSFITNFKEWENARNAPHYTMHFVVLSHEHDRDFNLWIQGIILWFSWFIPRQLPCHILQSLVVKYRVFFSAYSRGLYLQEQESSYPLLEIEKPVCAAARLSFRVEYLTIPSANFSCAQRLQPCAASWQLCDLTYLSRSTPGACISLVTCGLVFRILLKASDRES